MLEFKNIEVAFLERSVRSSNNSLSVGELDNNQFFERDDIKRGSILGSVEPGKGYDHFLSGISVCFEMKCSQYMLTEMQKYHWFNIVSSQSKTQRLVFIANNSNFNEMFNKYVEEETINKIKMYVDAYNLDVAKGEDGYNWFMRAISNLPLGFEIWMTVNTNYLQLKTMYLQRKNHKLREDWGIFINMCENLPFFTELILKE